MKERFFPLAIYGAVLAADFYLLPLLMRDTGTAMVLMLAVMPLVALVTAVACGLGHGFQPMLPLAAAVLFLPTIFLYYNLSAWVYAPFYGLVTLLGNLLGRAFYRKR